MKRSPASIAVKHSTLERRAEELPGGPVSPFIPAARAQEIMRSGERRILVASYPWRSAGHPDPTSTYLKRIIRFLRWFAAKHNIEDAEQHRYGLFIDWMSLWQGQRSSQQARDFNEGLSVMTSLFGSLHGTSVLRISSVSPARPAAFDGHAYVFTSKDFHPSDAADAEASLRAALPPGVSHALFTVAPLRVGTTNVTHAWDLCFRSQEQAEAAVSAGDGVGLKIFAAWNERPYWQRSWCVHEDAIAKLATGICNAVPGVTRPQLLGKLYDVSSADSKAYAPIEVAEPEPLEAVVGRIDEAVTTSSADKTLVISSFTDYARKLSEAADPTHAYVKSSYATSAHGLRQAARYGAPLVMARGNSNPRHASSQPSLSLSLSARPLSSAAIPPRPKALTQWPLSASSSYSRPHAFPTGGAPEDDRRRRAMRRAR